MSTTPSQDLAEKMMKRVEVVFKSNELKEELKSFIDKGYNVSSADKALLDTPIPGNLDDEELKLFIECNSPKGHLDDAVRLDRTLVSHFEDS